MYKEVCYYHICQYSNVLNLTFVYIRRKPKKEDVLILKEKCEGCIMILGDFNFITSRHDSSNPNYRRKTNTESYFKNFLKKNNLADVHLNASEGHPPHTFRRPFHRSWTMARLDRIYETVF